MWFAYGLALLANSFAEEIVMRGYMIDRLEQLFGKSWLEILISSLLLEVTISIKDFWERAVRSLSAWSSELGLFR